MVHMIQVENLIKKFGDVTVVQDLSFHIDEGKVFSLLGPNGAGGTTTSSDIQAAQQTGALIILPFGAIYVLSELSVIPFIYTNLLILSAILFMLDLIFLYLARAAFRREEILMEWK